MHGQRCLTTDTEARCLHLGGGLSARYCREWYHEHESPITFFTALTRSFRTWQTFEARVLDGDSMHLEIC
jgi:hypothetical protein